MGGKGGEIMASSNGNVNLRTFPSDRRDALAILYLQNQDLSGKTPEELADMYDEAWDKISQEFDSIRDKKREDRHKAHDYTPLFN